MSKTHKTNAGQTRAKSCTGKTAFPTPEKARGAMFSIRRRLKTVGFMEVYKCKYCGLFHYGHAKGAGVSRSFRIVNAIDRALAADAEKRARATA